MLGGIPISSLVRFTALTASPSEAFGARLNESVTTGNWPWWLTVIGAFISSTWLKAESGTWPPLGNIEVDATGPPPKTPFEAMPEEPPVKLPEAELEERLAPAAESELEGPNRGLAADPPATRPEDPVVPVAPVRMYRCRRSRGFC